MKRFKQFFMENEDPDKIRDNIYRFMSDFDKGIEVIFENVLRTIMFEYHYSWEERDENVGKVNGDLMIRNPDFKDDLQEKLLTDGPNDPDVAAMFKGV